MADNRTVYQQAFEGFTGDHSPIITPVINNPNSWQIPSYVITNLIQSNLFHSCDDEDAPSHINRLTRALRTFNLQGANEDAIFLHLFPFSLIGRAATWLDSQPTRAFTTCEALHTAFLRKYFPHAKASRLRDQIHSFHMDPDEPYYQAWERFQGLLACCSQHGLTPWALVEKFYNGLIYETQARFDTAGGNLMDKKNVVECSELFESFAQSDFAKKPRSRNSNPVTSTPSSVRGVHQVNQDTSVAAALESLASEIKNLKAKIDKCELCRGGHGTLDCPLMSQEQGGEIEVEESDDLVDEEIVTETPGRVQPRLDPASTAPTNEPISRGSEEKKLRDVRPSPLIDHSRLSYPARAKNQIFRREYGNFLDMFRQLRINLPFIEVLQHMPKYAKFLKDILKQKESLKELSTVPLNGECSAVVLNKVLEKLPDPGVFIVPCLFGRDTSCQALADLGASINLMPYSLFEKLGLGELTPTRMTLSLADHSVKYPIGIVENLLVKVDGLVFPVDFVGTH
ncbi:uncharacterized protein LOC143558468 [Bidens hawaiensis]|uniref:uncharacterized protein LOC143558468 n=1 Tax=Bidens hawaiensis TaxID=980011 RepID=UPI004049B1DD